uniref:ribosomal protein L5 n=1 Tax=Cephaleuros parasiticus TaxID=173370 RepID=UPI001EDDBC44|nr:ribosomal protein L5 [Cephaleuros parasiticus]UIB38995.1 ribosomal protein L5 [Cephaleuros parasiticus]
MNHRLKNFYIESIRPQLKEQLGYSNFHAIPKLEKIVVHRGIGGTNQNQRLIDSSLNELSNLSAQKGVISNSKKSIATFKLRKNMPVGIAITLRKNRMFAFLDRLINLALPRIRDFNGLNNKSFDGRGSFSMGLSESLMFPELSYDSGDVGSSGLQVTIVTSAKTDKEALALLKAFQMPFRD